MTAVSRVALALAGLILCVPRAHAQNAGAEALFRDGRNLIKQGNVKAGCDKLEASEKLESSVGTLLNLGDCREKLGKPASAWAAFRKAEALAKRDGNDRKRMLEARRRANALEADLANITVQVGPKSKSEGLVIKRDGEVLDPALYGNAIVVDPGAHVVTAESPGRLSWKADVSVGKGGKRWVVVPTLEPVPEAPPPPRVVVQPAPPPAHVVVQPAPPRAHVVVAPQPPPPARTITVHHTWSTTRGIAVALGVIGAGAIGTGVYFGTRADDLQTQSNRLCPTATCDDPQGLRLNDEAKDQAFRANVLFAAGGAAVAVGTVMWFVGKPSETTVIAPAISDTHVGASLTGRF
jgi:serine/threonine-protein kinase